MLRNNIKEKIKKNRWVLLPVLFLVLTLLVFRFVLLYALVPSPSMEPYIPCGSLGLANRLSYVSSDPTMGDVVVIESADGMYLVKRVIGTPGDTVELSGDGVYVNGIKTEEDYLKEPAEYKIQTFVIPSACYFVLGDNRNNSEDSRYWEQPYVIKSDIIGKWMYGFQFVRSDTMEER